MQSVFMVFEMHFTITVTVNKTTLISTKQLPVHVTLIISFDELFKIDTG